MRNEATSEPHWFNRVKIDFNSEPPSYFSFRDFWRGGGEGGYCETSEETVISAKNMENGKHIEINDRSGKNHNGRSAEEVTHVFGTGSDGLNDIHIAVDLDITNMTQYYVTNPHRKSSPHLSTLKDKEVVTQLNDARWSANLLKNLIVPFSLFD